MKVESDGLSLTFGHTSMTIFPQLAHKPSFQPTFLFKKEKEINFGWKEVACGKESWALACWDFLLDERFFLLWEKEKLIQRKSQRGQRGKDVSNPDQARDKRIGARSAWFLGLDTSSFPWSCRKMNIGVAVRHMESFSFGKENKRWRKRKRQMKNGRGSSAGLFFLSFLVVPQRKGRAQLRKGKISWWATAMRFPLDELFFFPKKKKPLIQKEIFSWPGRRKTNGTAWKLGRIQTTEGRFH